jgi:AcrR family transcriptional regulator
MNHVTRAYELKQRAERQEQTRQRIIEAAIELHQTLGPARTTVTDIADRAGVSRLTVYRHFPDELALGMACSGLYWELHPLPDPEAWRSFPTLAGRLRAALEETYAYHRQTEPMMSHALADSADTPIMQPYHEHWRHAAAVVAKAGPHGDPGDPMLRAAVGHALAFGTWRSLTRDQELTDREAIELMLRLVPAAES